MGEAFKGGRIVLPDHIESLSDGAKMILEVIDDKEQSLSDHEEELRAVARRDFNARIMLKNLFERREQQAEWVIEAFLVAIERGLDFEFPITESFSDDIKTIIETSVAGKPTLQHHADELRDAITDPYVLEAFERLLKRKENADAAANSAVRTRNPCASCPPCRAGDPVRIAGGDPDPVRCLPWL